MKLEKLRIRNLRTGDEFTCLFNPTEYSVAKTNQWKEKPVVGKNVPKLDFTGGGSRKLTLQLLLDVFEVDGANVNDHVKKLEALTRIDEAKINPKTKRARPPFCQLEWGTHWTFKAVITSLTVKYVLFREDGTPVRATADATFQEGEPSDDEADGQKPTNPSSHAEPGRKRRLVGPRDTLAGIAYDEYGDPTRWRRIADDNHLEDPLDLHPGQVLSIPPL